MLKLLDAALRVIREKGYSETTDPSFAADSLDHLRRYIEQLFQK